MVNLHYGYMQGWNQLWFVVVRKVLAELALTASENIFRPVSSAKILSRFLSRSLGPRLVCMCAVASVYDCAPMLTQSPGTEGTGRSPPPPTTGKGKLIYISVCGGYRGHPPLVPADRRPPITRALHQALVHTYPRAIIEWWFLSPPNPLYISFPPLFS